MTISIAVDAPGGDHGLPVTVPASLAALSRYPDLHLALCGPRAALERALAEHDYPRARLGIVDADETVEMHESPVHALRNKKNSSMRRAIDLVQNGEANACVSAGNTGALMLVASVVLKTLSGIQRPAIVSTLPRINGWVHVLDLGANVESPPELLLQFGVMGAILVRYVENKPEPSVGLLNIGVEDIKGNDVIRKAAALMRDSELNYYGFVEGDAIYTGDVDVVVCDGLVGNVALKASEGLAQMVNSILRQEFKRSPWRRLAALAAAPAMLAFRERTDHRRYNGATLLGLRGTVIKSHGGADSLAFGHALDEAHTEVLNRVPEHIESELGTMLPGRSQGQGR